MLEAFDIVAIAAGIATALVTALLAGAALGMGIASDAISAARKNGLDLDEYDPDEIDAQLEEAFEKASDDPLLGWQMLAISLTVSALSGAVTGWLAPQSPLLNAAVVGGTGTIIGMVSGQEELRRLPSFLRIGATLSTLPATLSGAWMAA